MTFNIPEVKQFIQKSEQVFDRIEVPVQIGGETFIIVQQDVRKIEDIRNLSYYKYPTEQQSINTFTKNTVDNRINTIDQNHLWDNLTTALLMARSIETDPQQQYFINLLLESLYHKSINKNYIAPIQTQMQWESSFEPTNQQLQSTNCAYCCSQCVSNRKQVQFIESFHKCPLKVSVKSRGSGTCCIIEEEEEGPSAREQLLEKEKAADISP